MTAAALAHPDRPWKQTLSGRAFPMVDFGPENIDLFGDVPESLARICRYGGHVPGNPYSVAQHCVLGADAALAETGDANLAAYLLLHDAHESIFGDMITPVAHWLDALAVEMCGPLAAHLVPNLIHEAKQRLDRAIWKAAGVAPPGPTYRAAIADYDLRLLATEKRQLLNREPMSWGASIDAATPIRMRGKLVAWPVAKAADAWRERLEQFCPNAMRI